MKTGIWLLAIFMILPLSACRTSGNKVGGPCTYTDIPGTAVIQALEVPLPSEAGCYDPVRVVFDFIPGPGAGDKMGLLGELTAQRLTVGGGMNPSRIWADLKGLRPGKNIPCVRKEIDQGTCTPVVYTFPGLNMDDWEVHCWPK